MKRIGLGIVIAVSGWILTGVYAISANELGLVQRFGAVVGTAAPGLHWGLPIGLERIIRTHPGETKRILVGYESADPSSSIADANTLYLTGDENLIQMLATIQYRIEEPAQYYFATEDPVEVLHHAAQAAISATLADLSIDAVLTVEKPRLPLLIEGRLSEIISRYELGVEIIAVNPQLSLPSELVDAFTSAAQARTVRSRLILDAKRYAAKQTAMAHAGSDRRVAEAVAFKRRRVSLAESEAGRFLRISKQSRTAGSPELTWKRLYLETFSTILPKIRAGLVVDSDLKVDVLSVPNQENPPEQPGPPVRR